MMKPFVDRGGYHVVSLSAGGSKFCKHKVHRVVATTFLERAAGYTDVDHINGDRQDNAVDNLRWCTRGQNLGNMKKRKRKSADPVDDLPKNVRKANLGKGWHVCIQKNYVSHYFGTYSTVEEAAEVAKRMRREMFDQFARDV